jgi:hypothetical protein
MRKPTTVVHIGLGVVTALVALSSPGLAALLFGGFALYEYWSEKKGRPGGCEDFWEGLLGLGLAATVIALVTLVRAIL